MHSANLTQEPKPYFFNEVPVNGRDTYEMYQKISSTFLNMSYDLTQTWELKKALHIRNPLFEREFDDKSKELQEKSSFSEHWEVRYGFLATIKEKMIEKVAGEGLEVKMCPYNYLGYNIAGIHVSQNADVCLTEARSKIVPGDELILILFQYMLGKRKIVAMHDPKVLLAPTPKFDSHICEERPDPKEKDSMQYIKSLVYLYEFANGNMDPVIRPRHCCPIAALIFKNMTPYETLDISGSEQTSAFATSYQSPLALLKPISHHTQPNPWGRQYTHSEYPKKSSLVGQKGDEDPRKMSEIDNELYDIEKPTTADESWRTMSYGSQSYPSDVIVMAGPPPRDTLLYNAPKGTTRNGESMLLKSVERDRSPDRGGSKWSETISRRGGSNRSSRGSDSSHRVTSARGSKPWLK